MIDEQSSVVVTLDIGSSSVRCIAFEVLEENEDDNNSGDQQQQHERVAHQRGIGDVVAWYSMEYRSVDPTTGKILLAVDNESNNNLLSIIDRCVDEVLKKLKNYYNKDGRSSTDIDSKLLPTYKVVAFGFSSFVMNFIAVDDLGQVLGNDYTMSYACNAPTIAQEVMVIKELIGYAAVQSIYKLTGAPIHSAYALAQLRVIYNHKKEIDKCSQISKWLTIASICLVRWTGRTNIPISYSEASWTGLLNYKSCQYESTILNLLPESCRDHLPQLADYNDVDFFLSPNGTYWDRWPELRDVPFYLGVGDGACANIGSKCTTPERIACTVGTSAAVRICIPLPAHQETIATDSGMVPFHNGLFCYRIDKNNVLIGGAITDGGSVIEWIQQLLRIQSHQELQQFLDEAASIYESETTNQSDNHEYSSNNVTFVPFLSGERSTGFRSAATGTFHGLTRQTTPVLLVKACLEGVISRLAAIIQLLQNVVRVCQTDTISNNTPPTAAVQIICSGKALEVNQLWRQMLADCTATNVIFDKDTKEGTSRGAALLILYASKDKSNSSYWYKESISCEIINKPITTAHVYWQKINKSQDKLINAVSPLYQT